MAGIEQVTDKHNRDKTEPRDKVFMANHPERRVVRQLLKDLD
jgi:hypothetical protein